MTSVVLLVVALAAERRALRGSLQRQDRLDLGGRRGVRGRLAGRDALLVQAGIGRSRARAAVLDAASEFAVRAVWSVGFAGGLIDGLQPGHLVYPAAVLDDAARDAPPLLTVSHLTTFCAALRRAALTVEPGNLISAGAPLCSPEAKRAAARRSGVVAVEMEAAGVAQAARDLGIPWAALKAIVDGVEDPLPPFLAACTTPEGSLRWRGLAAGVLEGRVFWQSLRRLEGASRRAGRSLRQGLDAAFGAWAALTGF